MKNFIHTIIDHNGYYEPNARTTISTHAVKAENEIEAKLKILKLSASNWQISGGKIISQYIGDEKSINSKYELKTFSRNCDFTKLVVETIFNDYGVYII